MQLDPLSPKSSVQPTYAEKLLGEGILHLLHLNLSKLPLFDELTPIHSANNFIPISTAD